MNDRDEAPAGSLRAKLRELVDDESETDAEGEESMPRDELDPTGTRETREPPPKRPTDPPF